MKKAESLSLVLILIAFLALGLAYGIVILPFEALDEAEHFGVVRYVADTGRLPVQGDASLAAYHVRQEASQPPLYYLVAGPLLRVSSISTANTADYLVPNPYVTCGTENIRADKAVLRHNPFAEAFPWSNTLLGLHLLRALSTVMQAFTVAGMYAIARRVFPAQPGVATLAAALTAFNPQFLIVASGVNNDNVATPVVTWAVYLTIVVAQEGISIRRAVSLGALIGLAAISKLTGLLLLALAVLAVGTYLKFQISNLKSQIGNLVILGCVTLAVSGWWYIRNWQLYGDPTGLAPMLDIVGRRSAVPLGLVLSEFGLVFRSYWGQLPCAFFDSMLYYSAWTLVVVLGAVGAVWGLFREKTTTRIALYLLAAWLGLVLIGWLRWDLTTPAPGGRLLFTAVGATSTLLAFGLTRLPSLFAPHSTLNAPRSVLCAYGGATAMAGVGLLALLAWVRPLFAPPPTVDLAHIRAQHSLQARFGESVALLGYDLRADGLGPGRYADVTLYWRALEPMSVDYTLALQLAAPAPGDTRTLINFNTWPGGGNLPTSAWRAGPVIVDRYHVPLPIDTGLTQAWKLQVLLYDAQTGERLPLTLDAQPAGEALTLSTVRVKGTSVATLPDAARLAEPVTFDQAIILTHAQAVEHAVGVHVQLLWTSQKPLSRDVTVFVHAYDAGGKLITTGDGPPMEDNFPTSLWQNGDQVLDEHVLILPNGLSLNDVQIKVGLYQPQDGDRLPAVLSRNATRLPDDAVMVWPR
jgi:4-amino-4-deoxy-L-arabinose transferase-like glycosyltransferase